MWIFAIALLVAINVIVGNKIECSLASKAVVRNMQRMMSLVDAADFAQKLLTFMWNWRIGRLRSLSGWDFFYFAVAEMFCGAAPIKRIESSCIYLRPKVAAYN